MSVTATALGIDVGGTNFRIAEIDATGHILSRHVERVTKGREAFLARLVELVVARRSPNVRTVGVGVPGRVDAAAGLVLSAGYLELAGLPLAAMLGAAVGLPVAVENDCTMALVAECAVGAARGCDNVVMFSVGTGIGGAIAQNGQPVHGRATAGQFGHITVQPGGRICNCGRRGCVETTSSGTSLGHLMREAGLPADTDIDRLFTAADAGDTTANAVLSAWATPMRDASTSMAAAFDPDLVLFGGGLGQAMVRALGRLPPERSWYTYAIAAAELDDDAGVIGAGLRALSALGRRPTAAASVAFREARAPSPSGLQKRRQGHTIILVNGVPASGKSTVAAIIARRLSMPILNLDTIKEALFDHLGTGDRDYNRLLGKASYQAIFSTIAGFPDGLGAIVDAWHKFQPLEVLQGHLARASAGPVLEVWCRAPPELIAERYRTRATFRHRGHPPASYADDLATLAAHATPLGVGPTIDVATDGEIDEEALIAAVNRQLSP